MPILALLIACLTVLLMSLLDTGNQLFSHSSWVPLFEGLALLLCVGVAIRKNSARSLPRLLDDLANAEAHLLDQLSPSAVTMFILVLSALGLYNELMMIRLHATYFQLFAYFKNVSLLSCFLGLGIGFAGLKNNKSFLHLVMPLLALQIFLLHLLHLTPLGVFLHNPLPDQLTFGMLNSSTMSQTLGAVALLMFVFILTTLGFVPIGQAIARLMRRQLVLEAYGWNLLGSLAGILLFTFLSYCQSPPVLWFAIATAGVLWVLMQNPRLWMASFLSLIGVMFVLAFQQTNRFDFFSPYQLITLSFSNPSRPEVLVSHTYHQNILNLSTENVKNNSSLAAAAFHYGLPYRLMSSPADVLIVGSGTGNDVAAAVRYGAAHIDAVEIDPTILDLGRQFHPESPYASPRVSAHLGDARTFIRGTSKKYDLVIFGLLDSHTLLSGASGVRLDSYVYTVDCFREVRQLLKPGGQIVLTFCLIHRSIAKKLLEMLRDAFEGQTPAVYETGYDNGLAFVIGETPIHPPGLQDIGPSIAAYSAPISESTDDWPFFYMPRRHYPPSFGVVLFLLVAISAFLIKELIPQSGRHFSPQFFLFGAAFMLLETTAITKLALEFGSTWLVVTVVISVILLLSYAGNKMIFRGWRPSHHWLFLCLLGSLGFAYWASGSRLLEMWPWVSRLAMTFIFLWPCLFAGILFSSTLDLSQMPLSTALSANILGAMVGGFLEYNAMALGTRSLFWHAGIIYAVIWALGVPKSEKGQARI